MTQDKRIKKSKGRKFLWWFICLALVLALIVVAILAATGVIFNASPTTPVESRTFGDKNVNTAGFLGAGAAAGRNNNNTTTAVPIPPEDLENTVPNAVQGQLTFKNMNFKPNYNDPEDPEFQTIAKSLSRELQEVLMRMNPDVTNVKVNVTEMK